MIKENKPMNGESSYDYKIDI